MSKKPISKRILAIAMLGLTAMSLQGCGEKIDARQTQIIQGLVYKLNAGEPFTGTVINAGSIGQKSMRQYGYGNCTIKFKNGMRDGTSTCVNGNGVKVSEIELTADEMNGAQKQWNDDGVLIVSSNWVNGQVDGLEEDFNAAGKRIISIHWSSGAKNGEEKLWSDDGSTVIAVLNWADQKATGYVKETASDGQPVSDIVLKDGIATGTGFWSNKSKAIAVYRLDPGTIKFTGTATSYDDPNTAAGGRTTNHWAEGRIEGLEQHFDANGQITSTVNYKNGLRVPLVQDQPVSNQNSSQSTSAPAPVIAQAAATAAADSGPFSPSFNCDKASSYQERLICSDRDLSKLDVDLTAAYSAALAKAADKHQLRSDQIAWVKTSRNTCADRNCMVQTYQQRIAALTK